jgi:hypothetical protein
VRVGTYRKRSFLSSSTTPKTPSQVKMATTIKTLLGKIFSFLRCGPGDADDDHDHEAPPRLLVIVRSHTFVVHSITSLLIEYTTGGSYRLPSRGDRGGRVPACAHCRCSSSLCAVMSTCCMLLSCNATRLDDVLINHSYTLPECHRRHVHINQKAEW